jgi:hypothetical protein
MSISTQTVGKPGTPAGQRQLAPKSASFSEKKPIDEASPYVLTSQVAEYEPRSPVCVTQHTFHSHNHGGPMPERSLTSETAALVVRRGTANE